MLLACSQPAAGPCAPLMAGCPQFSSPLNHRSCKLRAFWAGGRTVLSDILHAQPRTTCLGRTTSTFTLLIFKLLQKSTSPGSRKGGKSLWNSVLGMKFTSTHTRTDAQQETFKQYQSCEGQPSEVLSPSLCKNYFLETVILSSALFLPQILYLSSVTSV